MVPPDKGKDVIQSALGYPPTWSGKIGADTAVELTSNAKDGDLGEGGELLCRICGPFNGKETYVPGGRGQQNPVAVKPARHPCFLNWYMPRRDGFGILEVRVDWKSQLETLLQIPKPGFRNARSRQKCFIVAGGAEYRSAGGRFSVVLRGTTKLPDQDGGRAAFLWLLAAGVPREGNLVALAAPRRSDDDDEVVSGFEVRAVRMWRRTFWLPNSAPITDEDLHMANGFRHALRQFQRRKPHRLAGTWRGSNGETIILDCVDMEASLQEEEGEVLRVCGLSRSMFLVGGPLRWVLQEHNGHELLSGTAESDGQLCWTDETSWTRREDSSASTYARQSGSEYEQQPLLSLVAADIVEDLRHAADELLEYSRGDESVSSAGGKACSRRWPARLVPLRQIVAENDLRVSKKMRPKPSNLELLDLGLVERYVNNLRAQLTEADAETDDEGMGVDCDEEDDDDQDDEADAEVDVSQQTVHEEFMWRLADKESWTLSETRQVCFVESAIALPPEAMCVDCEQVGKVFSKSQASRHPDDRRCKDCIAKALTFMSGQNRCTFRDASTALAAPPQMFATCSVCKTQLTKENISTSQRAKAPSRRKCNACVIKPGSALIADATPVPPPPLAPP